MPRYCFTNIPNYACFAILQSPALYNISLTMYINLSIMHICYLHCIALAIIVDSDIKLRSVTGLSEDKNSPQSIPQAIFSMVTLGLLL